MFAKLTGILDSASLDRLILDVNGVGYEIHASARTRSRAGTPGDPLSLLIDTHVREDAIALFGFIDAAEQQWFRLLYSVQGVGPKAALAILSACPIDRLGFAIAAGDAAALRQAEGVGPKLATRIVTELKEKAAKIEIAAPAAKSKGGKAAKETAAPESADNDAVSALVNLGYGRADAYAAVMRAQGKANDNEAGNLQSLIRLALKELSS
jgi:Holliday junction DNA helicase RuvA